MNKQPLQVCFLPWANLREEIRIGQIIFWPWDTNKIPDSKTACHLNNYFQCYVNHHGKPANEVTICSLGDYNRFDYSEDEIDIIGQAVNGLIFSTIAPATITAVCADNSSMAPPTSEKYQLTIQKFTPGENHIAVRSGFNLNGSLTIDELQFQKPWCVGGGFNSRQDIELLRGLICLLTNDENKKLARRILRSIEWFRLAHYQYDGISDLSRIVMMSTAFEILLQFPERGQTQHFSSFFDKNFRTGKSLIEQRQDSKGKTHSACRAAWWAWDFYDLRSRIVHGDKVDSESFRYKGWINQMIVADVAFWQCIIFELFKCGIIGAKVRELASNFSKFSNENSSENSEPEFEWDVAQSSFGFNIDSVHQALGWSN